MEKDWTGSAIPSVLKGFTLIGQPIKAEEFKNAFGYEMPEIALNEEEKRRVAQNNGLEPAIGYEENQPVAKTEQTALNFGREVLARIKEGDTLQAEQNKQAQQEQQEQDLPLQIEIRGVGNSQTEEDKTETSQTNKDGSGTIGIHDPYTARNLEILKNRNQANQQESPEQNSSQTYANLIGQNENADNIAAQPDPEGKHPNAFVPLQQEVNRFTREFVEKTADITRRQQETGNQNHLLNWIADVARNALQTPVTHPRLDYQSVYQGIFGHSANQKLAEAAAEPIKTDVNGKEKHQIVSDAFTNEYITEPGKLGMALVSLADHAFATANGGKPINPSVTKKVDENLFNLIKKSNTYLKNSVTIEKLNKAIVAGDDAKTVENFTRFGYELLGEKGPYAAVTMMGAPLMAGAAMTGTGMTAFKMIKDFGVNLAEANASIVKEKGTHDWELAFKIASIKAVGGKAIDGQMKTLIKTAGKGGVFIEQLGDALKKRFNSMVDGWMLNKGTETDPNKDKNKTRDQNY